MRGNHSPCCDVGGAVLHGHNWCRDWLKELLERWRPGVPILIEQRVIAWDRVHPVPPNAPPGMRPTVEEAELDIRFPQSTGRMLNVDIGFTDPYTRDVAEVRRRAREPGRAAAAYVCTISMPATALRITPPRIWCRSSWQALAVRPTAP